MGKDFFFFFVLASRYTQTPVAKDGCIDGNYTSQVTNAIVPLAHFMRMNELISTSLILSFKPVQWYRHKRWLFFRLFVKSPWTQNTRTNMMIMRVWKEESQTYRRVIVNHYIVTSAAMLLIVKWMLSALLNSRPWRKRLLKTFPSTGLVLMNSVNAKCSVVSSWWSRLCYG